MADAQEEAKAAPDALVAAMINQEELQGLASLAAQLRPRRRGCSNSSTAALAAAQQALAHSAKVRAVSDALTTACADQENWHIW